MSTVSAFVLLSCLSFIAAPRLACSQAVSDRNLTFMLITSFGEFGFDSSGAIPAADLALEDIYRNSSMLPGYRLVYDKPRNSQVAS